jgi:hypothetical protein
VLTASGCESTRSRDPIRMCARTSAHGNVTEDREPGRPGRSRCRPVPPGEKPPHHVLVEGNAEGQGDLLRDPWTPQVGFGRFMSTTAAMTSCLGPFGPGFGTLDEKSRRYFRVVSARWRLKSVESLTTIAERITRPGRMTIA